MMRAIAGKEWGAERDSMLTYQDLIRSTTDYGCMIYGFEMPLRLRRVKFSLVLWITLKSYTGERIAKYVLFLGGRILK